MSEEHKVYVPLRGMHVQPEPILKYSARWYEKQGIKFPREKFSARRILARRLRRAGIELNREEGYLRLWRLFISWDCE